MLIEILKTIYHRDLQRLYDEIELYKDETVMWKTERGIKNCGGNLCLHLIGNLETYIGQAIGKFEYTRNRELEFSLKDVPKTKLLEMVKRTSEKVMKSLDKVEDMENEFPLLIGDEKRSVGYSLVHLSTHLTYHLGQINYHRRLMDH